MKTLCINAGEIMDVCIDAFPYEDEIRERREMFYAMVNFFAKYNIKVVESNGKK